LLQRKIDRVVWSVIFHWSLSLTIYNLGQNRTDIHNEKSQYAYGVAEVPAETLSP